jgi:GH35 family endo-1,4-beta-xylanase
MLLLTDVTRVGVAQVAKPARGRGILLRTGRLGSLRYDASVSHQLLKHSKTYKIMKNKIIQCLLVLILLVPAMPAFAGIELTGLTYSENFNTVNNITVATANSYDWVDNSTLPGWYATIDGAPAAKCRATNGGTASTDPPLWLTRGSDGTDVSLGQFNKAKAVMFGLKLINSTGKTITGFTLTYTGEQWSQKTGNSSTLSFRYSSDAAALTAGTWTAAAALDFASIKDNGTADNTSINGNAEENRKTITGTVSGLSIPDGGVLWLRWSKGDTDGNQPLSIDDLSLTVATSDGDGPSGGIELTGPTPTCSEDFNNNAEVATSGTYTWVDNSTIPGWYATINDAPAASYRATDGSSTSSAPPLWMTRTNSGTEASLGQFHGNNVAMFGLKLINSTEKTITGFTLTYTGEQWAHNTGGPNSLSFHYSSDATSLVTGGWTAATDLNFASIKANATTDGAIDGNDADNKKLITGTVSELSIPPGGVLWLRWSRGTAGRQPLSIDDLTLTAATSDGVETPDGIVLTSQTYSENFNNNAEVKTSGTYTWVDNSTIPGWHATIDGQPAAQYLATNGNTTSNPPLWMTRNKETEASLGQYTGSGKDVMFGLKLINGTGQNITGFTLTYTGEQWAHNTGGPSSLSFQYSSDATALAADSTWTAVTALDFVSIHSNSSKTPTNLDGNLADNKKLITGTVSDLSIPPGEVLWLRWSKGADGNQTLSIDDLTLTVETPAPVYPKTIFGEEAIASEKLVLSGAPENAQLSAEPHAVEGQSFPRARTVTVSQTPAQPQQVSLGCPVEEIVNEGDVLLLSFWMRAISHGQTDDVRVDALVEQRASPYEKILWRRAYEGSGNWRRYDFAFVANKTWPADSLVFHLRCGYAEQVFEIGGLSLLNYGNTKTVDELPSTVTYGGQEPGASWRAAAEARINSLRKGPLNVTVLDKNGRPIENATVGVAMTKNAFGFGSAVQAPLLLNAGANNILYREKVETLFNQVTLENDLKWTNWEIEGGADRALRAVDWLRDKGVAVRGHTLVWPKLGQVVSSVTGRTYYRMPADCVGLNADALKTRIDTALTDRVTRPAGKLIDWDVLNEAFNNYDVQGRISGVTGVTPSDGILGNAEMVHWFKRTRELDAGVSLYLNDNVVMTNNGFNAAAHDYAENLIAYLKNNEAPLDGFGIQGHFRENTLTDMSVAKSIMDRYANAATGLRLKITEFDFWTKDTAIQAAYLRDMLTLAYSHPAMDGFVLWGFWDGAIVRPGNGLYAADWTPKAAAEVWNDLVLGQWKTTVRGGTGADGKYAVSSHAGDYTVTVSVEGLPDKTQIKNATVTTSGTDLVFNLDVEHKIEIASEPDVPAALPGQSLTLAADVSSFPIAVEYKWEVSADWIHWAEITADNPLYAGAVTRELTILRVDAQMSGYQYRYTATNSALADSVSGTATLTVKPSPLAGPGALVVDAATGDLFVADAGAHVIYKILAGGGSTGVFAGMPGESGAVNGTGTGARFAAPAGIAIGAGGMIIVADAGNSALRTLDAAAVAGNLAGSPGRPAFTDGTGTGAFFRNPVGVVSDTAGNIYVADTGNHVIRRVSPTGETTTIAGAPQAPGKADGKGSVATFTGPTGIALSGANLYIADTGNHTIRLITDIWGERTVATIAGKAGTSGAADGAAVATARFRSPAGLAVDGDALYVADTGNSTVREITLNAAGAADRVDTLAGTPGLPGFLDGEAGDALLNEPKDVAVGPDGSLYIADTGNGAIRKISNTAPAVVSTLTPTEVDFWPVEPPPGPPPPESQPAGAGGGGAPSSCFMFALALLWLTAHRPRA